MLFFYYFCGVCFDRRLRSGCHLQESESRIPNSCLPNAAIYAAYIRFLGKRAVACRNNLSVAMSSARRAFRRRFAGHENRRSRRAIVPMVLLINLIQFSTAKPADRKGHFGGLPSRRRPESTNSWRRVERQRLTRRSVDKPGRCRCGRREASPDTCEASRSCVTLCLLLLCQDAVRSVCVACAEGA
jgi:hypothetical protein